MASAERCNLLLERAQQEFDAGKKPEAERLVQRVLAVVPADQQGPGHGPPHQSTRHAVAPVVA